MSQIPTTTTPVAPPNTAGIASGQTTGNTPGASTDVGTQIANAQSNATPAANNSPGNLVAAANAAPKLTSSAIVGVAATSTNPNDAAVKAQVAQAYTEAAKMADSLNKTGVDFQASFFKKASPALKSLLGAAGYKPPAAQDVASGGGGFWHNIVHGLDDVRHVGAIGLDHTVKPVAKDVGQLFSDVGGPVMHLGRDVAATVQSSMMGEGGQLANGPNEIMDPHNQSIGQKVGDFFSAFNPTDLVRNWHKVANGADSFQPAVVQYVQKEMGISGQTLALAQILAGGANLQSALQSVAPAERASAYALIESTPKFMDAVKMLSDSHLSPGQMLFGGLSAEQMHQVDPFERIGAIQGTQIASDTAGSAAAALALATGGVGPGIGTAFGEAAAGGTLAGDAAETSGLLDSLASVKATAAAAIAFAGPTTAYLAAMRKESVDSAVSISPFGIQVHPMSGVVDGIYSWYSNPLFVGMQARGAYDATAHSIALLDAQGNALDVGARYLNQGAERAWATKAVKAITSPWMAEHGDYAPSVNVAQMKLMGLSDNANWVAILQKEYPKLLDAQKAADAGDADAAPRAVGTLLGDQQAIINIMRGRLGGAMHDAQTLPHLTIPQRAIDVIKGIGESTFQGRRFNPDAMSYRELSVDAFGEPVTADGMELAKATDQQLGHAARWLRRPTNLVLDKTIIRYADPERIKMFSQLARYALPEEKVNELTNAYALLGAADEGKQFVAIKAMMGEVLHAANVDRTADGAKWMQDVLAAMDNAAGEGEMYVDKSNIGGLAESKAIFPSELADAVAVPSYADFYKFAKKSWFMDKLQMALGSDGMDAFMSKYWKRAMLLRSGFALRFGGEEVLSDMLRHGPQAWLKGRVVASLYDTANPTKEAIRAAQLAVAETAQKALLADGGDLKAINEMDTARMYQAVGTQIPDELLKAIPNPEQFKASIQGFSAMNYLRRVGVAYVGDDIMRAAYNLARRGVLDSAFEDYIDAVRGHGTVYFGDIPKDGDEKALILHEDGTPLRFRPTGKFRSFAKEDHEAVPAWSYRLQGVKNTEVGRGIARAHAFGGTDAQMQYAKDWINGVKFQKPIDDANELLNNAAAAWERGGSPEEGALWERMDAAQGQLDAAEARMEYHQRLINKFEVNFQTADGSTMEAGTATREEIVSDWARAMVRKVNRLTFTSEGQEFDANAERIPLAPGEQRPIEIKSTIPQKLPYKIGTRDEGRSITEVPSDELAYHGIPEGHIRLFRSENTFDATENPDRPGIGRAWTPDYERAASRAGEHGAVYKIDVPVGKLDQYDLHAAEGTNEAAYIKEIDAAQHPETKGVRPAAPAVHRGYFESGEVRHVNVEDATKRTLVSMVGAGFVPGDDELRAIDAVHRPDYLSQPIQMPVEHPGSLDALITKGMRNMVGKPANWISRQPIFTHNYTNALTETTKMLEKFGIEDDNGDLAHDIAMERAFNETIPFIHNPSSKSQMSVIVRNLAPFWFAQEQFYKRWGRLFGTYPEAWYKLSLTMNGLRSVGFVYTDSYGKEAFVYPGSQAVLSFLSRFPFHGAIPVGAALSGEISQLNPTLTTGGAPIPSLGPIVTIPLTIISGMFPGSSSITQHFFGPDAPQNTQDNWILNTIEQVTPSFLNRGLQWFTSQSGTNGADNVSTGIYMSTMITAAQQLEVSGHGLSAADQKNPVKTQQYVDRLANWTKNLLLMRTVFGFLAPATPTFKIADGGLGAQLTALMAVMPYDAAVTAFIKAHPNATGDTIFESTTSAANESGTFVPATQQAIDFMSTNSDFFKNFSQIAPYAIPANASKGLFSSNAYTQEIAMDLRTRRPLFSPDLVGSWYGEVKYSEGANVYYPEETLFQAAGSSTAADAAAAQATLGMTSDQALAALKLPTGTDVKTIWAQWKSDFDNTHPLFASQVTSVGAISTSRRSGIIEQLQAAITQGAMPQGEWSTRAEQLMAAYDNVQQAYPAVKGTTQATENWQAFLTWGTAFVQVYPVVAPLWNAVISKQKVG